MATSSSTRHSKTDKAGERDMLSNLLTSTADGDKAAFAELYNLTGSRLLGIAVKILGRRELAEEVLQEAFLSIWQNAGKFRADIGSPLGWLTTIVRHRAIDRLRMAGTTREVAVGSGSDLDDLGAEAPGKSEAGIIMQQAILNCLEHLKDNQRQLILLAFYYGLTHEELAARTSVPLGTVKSSVRRGLEGLRYCLEK